VRHQRRCPATTFRIENKAIAERWRCEKAAGHIGPHENADALPRPRWSFVAGSYSGLAEDHPDYHELVKAQGSQE
jgi:hypothetical protein